MALRRAGTAVGLAALVFGLYLLTMSGHTYSPDEETMLATAEAVGLHATFVLPRVSGLVEVPGADGRFYSQYGPGQPVAAAPWVWAGHALSALLGLDKADTGFVVRLALGGFNLLVGATLAALLYVAARRLGTGRSGALLLGLLLAFSTFLWPMSRTFFAEPLTGLLLFGAFVALLDGRRTWLGGMLAALALGVKLQYIVALPALGAYACWTAWSAWRAGDKAEAGRRLGGFVFGGVIGVLPLLVYNTLVFGSPTSSGYRQSFAETFTTPLLEGLNGLLLSPGKGLWIYAPPVLLGLAGFMAFARRHPAPSLTVAGIVVPVVGLFSLYRFWPGDGSWGPRYLLPLLPFLLLPAADMLPREGDAPLRFAEWPSGRRLLALGVLVLGASGLVVQLGGVLVNFDTYINLVNDDATRYWNAEYSPVRGHWQVLGQRVEDWLDRRSYPRGDAALLTGGFSYSEGDKYRGDLFPRWTTGDAKVALPVGLNYPLTLTMRLRDDRPPTMLRAPIRLLLAGSPVASELKQVNDYPFESAVTVTLGRPVTAGGQLPNLALVTRTWNPKKAGVNARNEDLGIKVESLALTQPDGRSLRLADGLPIQPMYPAPRWYYDTQSAHLTDIWAWYTSHAGLPDGAVFALWAAVLVPGLGLGGWGAAATRKRLKVQ